MAFNIGGALTGGILGSVMGPAGSSFGATAGAAGLLPNWFKSRPKPQLYEIQNVERPEYNVGYDPTSMAALPAVEKRLAALNMNTAGLEKLRGEALRRGGSKWQQRALQKQAAEEMDQRERAKQEAASGTASAEAQLAMRGGLSSGARERLASEGAKNMLAMSQDVGRQGNINRLGIDIQDEQNRINQLQQLPGMEQQLFQTQFQKEGIWNQAKQGDIQRLVDENKSRQAYNMSVYDAQMRERAAREQANAIMSAGKK